MDQKKSVEYLISQGNYREPNEWQLRLTREEETQNTRDNQTAANTECNRLGIVSHMEVERIITLSTKDYRTRKKKRINNPVKGQERPDEYIDIKGNIVETVRQEAIGPELLQPGREDKDHTIKTTVGSDIHHDDIEDEETTTR